LAGVLSSWRTVSFDEAATWFGLWDRTRLSRWCDLPAGGVPVVVSTSHFSWLACWQEEHAVGFAEIVHRDDIGMIQPGQGLGLALEPLGETRIRTLFRQEDLERRQQMAQLFLDRFRSVNRSCHLIAEELAVASSEAMDGDLDGAFTQAESAAQVAVRDLVATARGQDDRPLCGDEGARSGGPAIGCAGEPVVVRVVGWLTSQRLSRWRQWASRDKGFDPNP
jgi:hypothetical protein